MNATNTRYEHPPYDHASENQESTPSPYQSWHTMLQRLSVFLMVLAIVFCLSDVAAFASEIAESQCEENADDLKRLAYWLIIGGVLTMPVGIGAAILPVGGFLWIVAEFWWAIC